jgi:hypothetical protein
MSDTFVPNLVRPRRARPPVDRIDDEKAAARQNDMIAAGLPGIGPKDAIEEMVAAQMLACHDAAMDCFKNASRDGLSRALSQDYLNQGGKLSRTFAMLLDALNRHRGKGQQKITVEHVHVHSGGQAVVGVVEALGGGFQPKSENQPNGKQIAHAPQPAVRSAETKERASLPGASNAERPLPDTWRDFDWRAKGE